VYQKLTLYCSWRLSKVTALQTDTQTNVRNRTYYHAAFAGAKEGRKSAERFQFKCMHRFP